MTFDQWTATPMGASALSLAKRCDTFREAAIALKAAFEAGQLEGRVEGMGPKLEQHIRAKQGTSACTDFK